MTQPTQPGWRLRMGANIVPGGVRFRVWAPARRTMDVEIGDMYVAMSRDEHGVWTATVPGVGAGARYRFRVDGEGVYPDPYSRSQPEGPHGPSEVIDPNAYVWQDDGWRGLSADGLVVYECHVGTYTAEGTFDALIGQLPELKALGITAIEVMPVAEFPGERNWGYDGVDLFAPTRNYGGPDAFKRFVDAAHAEGLGVILDVVYNHFGPDGNYLWQYSSEYFTEKYHTLWGAAINYEGCDAARRLAIDNACYWLNEYHVDGLRLDAVFAIFDGSERHIVEELVTTARASTDRSVVLIAESHENDARYLRPAEAGGFGFDAVWADDFHHAVYTLVSGERGGYFDDYAGTTEELARTVQRGWLYEGRQSQHLGHLRGTPSDGLPARGFVYCIQNHDQVGNRAFGRRFSHVVGPAVVRPGAALLLLLPYTPMICMGQEFAASSRFFYFTDHNDELGRLVTEGRRSEFGAFAAFADPQHQREIPDPQAVDTFVRSKLNLEERRDGLGAQVYALYGELLALRRSDAVLRRQDRERLRATAASDSVVLVHMWDGDEQRLLVANFGNGVDVAPSALGVPGELSQMEWRVVLSTEERRFGGTDDQIRFDESLVSLPPQTVAWLAARRQPLVPRLLSRARRAVRRLRGR
jgi:maltooligosyltrehalose trehalohydrolase